MFGTIFGGILVIAGLVRIVDGNALGGTWLLLIGIFLAAAASQSRHHVNAAQISEGHVGAADTWIAPRSQSARTLR